MLVVNTVHVVSKAQKVAAFITTLTHQMIQR